LRSSKIGCPAAQTAAASTIGSSPSAATTLASSRRHQITIAPASSAPVTARRASP
jgi:hypothetical protein